MSTKRQLFFHRTTAARAKEILRRSFRDATGSYGMVGHSISGVWVSDRILDENQGARGDVVLRIEINLPAKLLRLYEVVEQGKPYREWCIPAKLLNRGKLTIHKSH